MKITFGIDHSPALRQQFHDWWRSNGLLATETVGPIRIDVIRRTITFSRLLEDSQPGDVDFPELRRDIENNPLTREDTVPLLVDPPGALWQRQRSKVA